MNHRFDWRKAICLMAVLALLCGMGVAAVANGEQQPIISIEGATDITRGEWVEVNVTSTVTGDGDEHIYYRAYILVEGGSIDNEGDIMEEAWAEPDAQQNVTLLLPTEALTEDCTYSVYVQAYKWENETDVPVGVASDPAEIAIAAATGDRTIVFRTNRGSSTEAANQVPFGYAVDFTVYAPGAERIQVYASNGDTWQYPDTDHARDAHYTDYDFTMQAEAFYSDGASVRSGVMYFDVTEPGGEMAPFTCWVEDAPEANSAFTVGFEASEPDPEAPEHETRYRLNMWDMTARSENFEEYDEPVYSAEKTVSDDDYTFVIPGSWGGDDQNSLVEGHAYRIEIEAWMVGVAYRSAYAHTAFAAAGENTIPPDEKNLSLAIGDNNDALTVRSGQDFELQIYAEDAVNVRVFDGEGYHNLNEDGDWEDELDWEGNVIREGWSSHPENIRIGQSRDWPTSYIWWVEAQYDGYDAWYRSNAVLLNVTSEGPLGVPAQVTVPEDPVTRGQFIPVTVQGLDERATYLSARVIPAGNSGDEESYAEADIELYGEDEATLYIPTAEVGGGEYRVMVECRAEGFDRSSAFAWVTVTEEGLDANLILSFSKQPDESGVIHLVPHEQMYVSIFKPNGSDGNRVALLIDDEEEDSRDGASLTKRWGSDCNGEFTFRAVAWDQYGEEQNPDYTSDTVTVFVEGYELDAPSNLSINPEMLILDGEESFTLTFNEVHTVVHTEAEDDVTQDAESYTINVDTEDGQRHIYDYDVDIERVKSGEDPYVTYNDASGSYTFQMPMNYPDGENEGQPIFEAGNVYRFVVAAFAYGWSTGDSEISALVMDEESENVGISVKGFSSVDEDGNEHYDSELPDGENGFYTADTNTRYRVFISGEDADDFEFFDGEGWRRPEEYECFERDEGAVSFFYDTQDSGNIYLSARGRFEHPAPVEPDDPGEDDSWRYMWIQGNILKLTVEGEPLPEDSLAYALYAGDAEEPLDQDENDAYHITRGTPLVVRFNENENEQEGQWYGIHLIDANGNWLDYHHWDDEDRSAVYPTEDVEAGEYQVRVAATAPGYDSRADYRTLIVEDADPGSGVFLSMDMADTDTCQNNTFRVYAPGAESVGLYFQENDERICDDFAGESGVCDWCNRGSSGVYHVYAEANYGYNEATDEWETCRSEVLTWTVHAPYGALGTLFIHAPAILRPDEDLTFTVDGIENAQNWGVRVYEMGYDNTVWENDFEDYPGEITVECEAENEYGESWTRFETGHTYAIAVYASAYGFDDTYHMLNFTVTDQVNENIVIEILDEEGNSVEPTSGDDDTEQLLLRSGNNYKVRVSGSSHVDSVDFYDGNDWLWGVFSNGDGVSEWSFEAPAGEDQFWNKNGGVYNLLVKAYDYTDGESIMYAGLQVTVTSEGRLGKPIVRIDDADRTVARGEALPVYVDGVENGEFYHLRIYDPYGTECYFTEDVRLGGYNFLPTGDLEAGEEPYRVDLYVGRYDWDGNSTSSEFFVTQAEYEEDGVQLKADRETEEGMINLVPNDEVNFMVYAPNCQHVELWRDGADEPEAWWDGSSLVYRWGGDRNEECTFRAKAWSNWSEGCEEEADRVSDPITVSLYGEPLAAPEFSIDSPLYPWSDPGNSSIEFSFNQVADAEWYRVSVQNVTGEASFDVWNDGYIESENPATNENVSYDEENGIITYAIPLWYEDGNPVFSPGEQYCFWVSACAYGRETTDGNAEVLMLNSPAGNVNMTVAGAEANQDATVSANSQYRVTIECEGATIFEYYDGDRWHEVHHRDNLSEEENADVGDEDGTVVFNWNSGDSCETVLTCRVMSEGDEDWTQGPVITLTVEGEPLPEESLAYALYAGDAEEPLDPDENDAYHITRGTPLVVRFNENENEQEGQWYGVHLIEANGNWLDYHHWDDEDRSAIYPTEDIEAGEYQVRVAATAPGYDSRADYRTLIVEDADPGSGVFLSADMDETWTCQNNTFRVYAPGAYSVDIYTDGNHEPDAHFDGEGGAFRDCHRDNSGTYYVYAVAHYSEIDPNEDGSYELRSEMKEWRVVAPNGALGNPEIHVEPILASEAEELTFTVADIEHAENWNIRVYDMDTGYDVWNEGYGRDDLPGEFAIPCMEEDESGEFRPVFDSGHTYAIAVYASAYGFDASYHVVPFTVTDDAAEDINIEVLDDAGEPVEREGEEGQEEPVLWTGRNYKVRVSGSGHVDSVEFFDGNEWSWPALDTDGEGDAWSFIAPYEENQFWNKGSGVYNLLVKTYANTDEDSIIKYAGLSVRVRSYGVLNKPNVFFWEGEGDQQYPVPTTTVTRGDVLRVHVDPVYREEGVELENEHYTVRIYGSMRNWTDEYWLNQKYEVHGTGDFELPTANLYTPWSDDPDSELRPMAWRVVVDVNADGWDNNSAYADFTVVEPEQEEPTPILTVANADDLWVNEEMSVTIYAPGATNVRIESDRNMNQDNFGEEDYCVSKSCPGFPGWITLTGIAEYPVEGGEEGETREVTVEKSVEIKSLGRIGTPEVIFEGPTLPADTWELTFSFKYGEVSHEFEEGEGWENFAVDEQYVVTVEKVLPEQEGYTEQVGESMEVPRGEGDTFGPITLSGDDGFQWIEGAIYKVNVEVRANRFETSNETATIPCLGDEPDGTVTLEVIADSGRELTELLQNEPLRLHITAPEDTRSVDLFNGQSWESVEYLEDYSDFWCGRSYANGASTLMVRAWCGDEGEEIAYISNPVAIRVICLGTLQTPEVQIQNEYATVRRGDFLDIAIGDVPNADWDGYDVRIEHWTDYEYWAPVDNLYKGLLQSGLYQVPTASLEPGRYRACVTASGIGWNTSYEKTVEFTVIGSDAEPDDQGFIVVASNDHPKTCEDWKVSAWYTGSDERVNRIDLVRADGSMPVDSTNYRSENSVCETWSDTREGEVVVYAVAGNETWNMEMEYQYTELFRSAPVTVTVEADGDLLPPEIRLLKSVIELGAEPAPETLDVYVETDEYVDSFTLNIFDESGMCVYSGNRSACNGDDGSHNVNAHVPLVEIDGLDNMYDGQSRAYRVEAYTCAWNKNDAGTSTYFVVVKGRVQPGMTIALAEGEDEDDLWAHKDFRVFVSAPEANAVRLRTDSDNGDENSFPTESGSTGVFTLQLDAGQHAVWAEASYTVDLGDGSGPHEEWSPCSPLILNIQTMGQLDAPTVTLGESVRRGEFMSVNIGDVYIDQQEQTLASGCELMVWALDEANKPVSGDPAYMLNDAKFGENLIPTASLSSSERYGVIATAHNEAYEDNWSEIVPFSVLEPEDGPVLSVSNENPVTGEVWTASAYVPGASFVSLLLEDENGKHHYFWQKSGSDWVEAPISMNRSGQYTVHVTGNVDGEDFDYTLPVTVRAPSGELKIALADVPTAVLMENADEYGNATQLAPFEIKVDVSQTQSEEFTVFVHREDGQTIYDSDPIRVDGADVDGIVTVPIFVDTCDRPDSDYYGQTIYDGSILRVEAYTCAQGYEETAASEKIKVMSGFDENVTLALAENEDADDLWVGKDFQVVASAPNAFSVSVMDDQGRNYYLNDNEDAITMQLDSGSHLIWAEAYFPGEGYDPETNPILNTVRSMPLRLTIRSNGPLDRPEVAVTNANSSVARGDFVNVDLTEVTADGAPVDGYELQVFKIDDSENGEYRFNSPAVVGENAVPTASLEPGEYYVSATAHKQTWDDNWTDMTEAASFTVTEPQNGLVLNVSTEQARAGEQWWVNAVYTGGEYSDIFLWAENENNDSEPYLDWSWSSDQFENSCYAQAAWMVNHSAVLTIHASVEINGNTVEQTAQVTVSAEGDLDIDLAGVPDILSLAGDGQESLDVAVTPSEDVESFTLTIYDPFANSYGERAFEEEYRISDGQMQEGVYHVSVPMAIFEPEILYCFDVYTTRLGWNDCYRSRRMLATAQQYVRSEDDENLVLTIPDEVSTGEQWTATACYVGDIDEQQRVESELVADRFYPCDEIKGNGNYKQSKWTMYHSGVYTVNASIIENDGSTTCANVEARVTVSAPNGPMSISLEGMDTIVRPDASSLEIPVTIGEEVEQFELNITQGGMPVLNAIWPAPEQQQDAPYTWTMEDDVVTCIWTPEQGVLSAGNSYDVNAYTCREGWDDAEARAGFVVTDLEIDNEGLITLTVDPEDENERTVGRTIWLCYSAEGADQIRLMNNEREVKSSYGEGPEYYQINSAVMNQLYWVEAHYAEGDVWKTSEPLTLNIIARGKLPAPELTLSSDSVPRGTPLTVTMSEVEGAERYSLTLYESFEGGGYASIGGQNLDGYGQSQLYTANLEVGKQYMVAPFASADGYYTVGIPQSEWPTFTVTEPENDSSFMCSTDEAPVNSLFTVSLYVKGARQVMISANGDDYNHAVANSWAQTYPGSIPASPLDGVVFQSSQYMRSLAPGQYTLYGWYTMDGTTWEKLNETVSLTLTASGGELTVPALVDPPTQVHYGDILVVEVAECENANLYRVELVDSTNNGITATASSQRAGKLYFTYFPDSYQVGKTYKYRVSVRGEGYAEQSAIVEGVTLEVLESRQWHLSAPVFRIWPAIRKGESINVRILESDPYATATQAEMTGMGYTVTAESDGYGNISLDTRNVPAGDYTITVRSTADNCVPGEGWLTVRVVDPDDTLILPRALKEIGEEAFSGVSAGIIVIPSGTTTIGSKAFANCENLGIVEIPGTVNVIAPDAFEGCDQFMIVCPEGSAAENFAIQYGITYDTPAGE